MDYKYIEQLLERYWICETSLEEEQILRAFFSQKELPEELAAYRELFAAAPTADETLGDDFDAKVLAAIDEPPTVKARTIKMPRRLMPLFKAAAAVAIMITIGNAAQFSIREGGNEDDINYAAYQDTFTDPETAYDNVQDALQLVSEGMSMALVTDTAGINNDSTAEE